MFLTVGGIAYWLLLPNAPPPDAKGALLAVGIGVVYVILKFDIPNRVTLLTFMELRIVTTLLTQVNTTHARQAEIGALPVALKAVFTFGRRFALINPVTVKLPVTD